MATLLYQHIRNTIVKEKIVDVSEIGDHKRNTNYENISSLGIKYPKLRDHPLHTGHLWLESKRIDDGAEGLWRIHNNLYDFSEFIDKHPGGKDWLELTKGTDITEAFECHHISKYPETLLSNYFIKHANIPRNSPFTFHEKDFYKVLKENIHHKLVTLPKGPANRSKFLTDLLFLSYISLALLATYYRSFLMGAISGICLALVANAAHNFFHKKDNFRMYYFDFTMMQSREWRISHVLSHHIYPNTVNDMEIAFVEPFLYYLPINKNLFFRYISWMYFPIILAFVYVSFYIRAVIQRTVLGQLITWNLILPFTVPVATYFITQQSALFCLTMFAWIIMTSSIYFGIVGLNAAHHHPDIFHDGDATRPQNQMDWGVYQLDAVMDRKDITGSHFLVLTNFGDHALHHLFPTIDHGHLEHLYPVFLDTLKQFDVEWRMTSQFELVKGQFRQLARIEPNKLPLNHMKGKL